jgi:mRNA interferase RelE/StbE
MLMFEVRDTADARTQFEALPLVIRGRVLALYQRLTHWPDVSGTKPLRKNLQGAYRVRTGDYRVLFTVDQKAGRIVVFRIAHRREVYE